MIKIENTDTHGWEAAIRGMRNPLNSWDMSDSNFSCKDCSFGEPNNCYYFDSVNHKRLKFGAQSWCDHNKLYIGPKDMALMQKLAAAGTDHAKYLRMITITADILAPIYWWKEYDTYKVGTVANSCSTMHKIADKEFTMDDFSHDHLGMLSKRCLEDTIIMLNRHRTGFLEFKDVTEDDKWTGRNKAKFHWWQMIQLLPSSYNQRRTVQLNYQVAHAMHEARRNHRLDEWHVFCDWVERLPYYREIFGGVDNGCK